MTADVRGWLGEQVRMRVVGPDAAQRHAELFDTSEPGWFEDDAPIRRVHADSSMFIGGLRALLFQSLHPRAMAGVAEHSDYRHDPWGRLQRTADFLAATTFGPASQAERAVEIVHRVHARVVGTTPDGEPYAANDPHLLRWVHLAELDSFLAAHDRFGEQPLVGEERDRYVEESGVIARAVGVVGPPTTERELRESRRRLRVLANTDPLTSVPNRRHFNELATRLLQDADDEAGAPVLLVCDIDHFKLINDRLGHAAGDRALRLVGRCLQDALRAHVTRFPKDLQNRSCA